MSGPGQTFDLIRRMFESFSGGIESYCWEEDIDASAAVQQLCGMKGSIYSALYSGTDAIRTRKGYGTPHLLAILVIDESHSGYGGYITVDGRTRAIRFGKMSDAGEFAVMDFTDSPILLPEGNKMNCYSNISGAGAEQHAVIVYVGYPKLPRHPELIPSSIEGPVGLKTGTRVADTFGPKTSDVLGDNLAFEDSEESFSQDPDLRYCIEALINGPGLADTSVVGINWPRTENAQDLELYFPAAQAGSESYILMPRISINPENPAKLAAAGKSTTSDEYGLHMGLNAPYGDMDLAGQNRPGKVSGGVRRAAGAARGAASGRGGQVIRRFK